MTGARMIAIALSGLGTHTLRQRQKKEVNEENNDASEGVFPGEGQKASSR
jgi:hypothetical protein